MTERPQKGVILEVSTRYANGFLNEYGQDLHKEEKTEYDFASLEVSDLECQQGR